MNTKKKDEIKNFFQTGKSFCPESDYQLQHNNDKAIFYKLENCSIDDIPVVAETIVITASLNTKLFLRKYQYLFLNGFVKAVDYI